MNAPHPPRLIKTLDIKTPDIKTLDEKSQTMTTRTSPRQAFTLVEILVVIAILGILMGIAIPAISGAVTTAKQTAQKLEVNSIAQAVEQYQLKYGDYPPDGSNQAVLLRHMRKLFPRMAPSELTLLALLTDTSTSSTTPTTAMELAFSGTAMDRAEALVFFLGGFSSDVQHPLTGPGGPLDLLPGTTVGSVALADYQVNATRENSLFDFDPSRLTYKRASDTAPLLSSDEVLLNTNDARHGGQDLLPTYVAVSDNPAPLVYFDSRTYGVIGTDPVSSSATRTIYNGYLASSVGGIRPYKTRIGAEPPSGATYGSESAAFAAIKFHNPDTFQVITPGADKFFGRLVSNDLSDAGAAPITPPTPSTGSPIHFVTETGIPAKILASATGFNGLVFKDLSLGSRGYQDSEWAASYTDDPAINGHLDNITNFSASVLGNELSNE